MTTASTTFSIVANTVSQNDVAPNVGVNTGGSFQYPTYIPVVQPSSIPSKEARITNVSMPSIVLPNSSFNVVVSFATYIAPATKYTVHLTIPQLSLDHSSTPITLSNLARGSTIFTITLPAQGHEAAENASGIVTGQIDLLNERLETDDGTPISFRVAVPGEERQSEDHHDNSNPPILIPPGVGTGDQDASGGTVIILANPPPPSVAPDLDVDVHGFEPFEDVDLDLLIPMVGKSDHEPKKADKDGHFHHHFHFTKPNINALIANIKVHGRHSNKRHSKNVEI